MQLPISQNENCSREKIAAYLDGELEPREELVLENHLANCQSCAEELNLQKQMFSALDSILDDKKEIELPKDFAKIVATRAETNVTGLRSKRERHRALFFCGSLFLILIAGGAWSAFASLGEIGEKIVTVLSFIGHLVYDVTVGVSVILRSVGNQPNISSAMIMVFLVAVFILPAIILSRYLDNSSRF